MLIYAAKDIKDLRNEIITYQQKQITNSKKIIMKSLKKREWNDAYKEWIELYLKIGINNDIYNIMVLLLKQIINIREMSEDILKNIIVLINNYFTYFENSDKTNEIIEIIIKFIEKYQFNFKFNYIGQVLNELFNMLYVKYKSQRLYIPELQKLQKIRDNRFILFTANLFQEYQIIGSASKLYELYVKQQNNKVLIKLNLLILLSFNQIIAAQLFIDEIRIAEIKEELQQILNAYVKNK